jgi:hypothetical protein
MGISGVQDEIEDGFVYVISWYFWIEYCSYSMPKRFAKHNPQPLPAPHEFDHDISTLPRRPDFHHTALYQQRKMKGGVAEDLVSRHHCSQHPINYSLAFLRKILAWIHRQRRRPRRKGVIGMAYAWVGQKLPKSNF